MIQRDTSHYFDENLEDYARGWSEDHLHYGFWYEDTKTHEESLDNTTRDVANYLNIQPGDRVLDAGCGTGGTCRYIVEKFGVETVGIALSDVLMEAAEKFMSGLDNQELMSLYNKDYNDTGFHDESFSKIIGLESVCHTNIKERFVGEAYRLLKNGGLLVVADFFQVRKDLNIHENKILCEWLDGWFIPNLATVDHFRELLESAGFSDIQYFNKNHLIKKSAKLMYNSAHERMPALLMLQISNKLPSSRLAHVIGTYRQKECLDAGIWEYGIFTANK